MMRNIYAVLLIGIAILLAECSGSSKVTYNIPDNYPEARRKQLLEIFEKGKILYRNNCSQCHGIFGGGRDSIPNFSDVQFDNYSARFLNGDPRNHAIARKMSQEQLNQVLTFLRYLKRKTPGGTSETK